MTKVKNGKCYLCGKTEELTDDHVPPKAFFPRPIMHDNLITVRACKSCNSFWGPKEALLVHDLSIAGDNADSRSVFINSTHKNYMRGAGTRGGPSADYYKILSRLKDSYLKNADGSVTKTSVTLIYIPKERDEVLAKIAKGLHKHHFGEMLPVDISYFVVGRTPLVIEDFYTFQKACSIRGRYGETFSYMGGRAADDINCSFWYLGFYAKLDFLVIFYDGSI